MFKINHQVATLCFSRTEPFQSAKAASHLRERRDNLRQNGETFQWLASDAWSEVNAWVKGPIAETLSTLRGRSPIGSETWIMKDTHKPLWRPVLRCGLARYDSSSHWVQSQMRQDYAWTSLTRERVPPRFSRGATGWGIQLLPYHKSRLHELYVAPCMKLSLWISSSSFGGALSQNSTLKCTGASTFVARTDSTCGNEKVVHMPSPWIQLRNCTLSLCKHTLA